MTYTVTYDDGKICNSGEFDVPERLPQMGDVYAWTRASLTVGGNSYDPSDRMMVLGRTNEAPHFRTSSLGNLLVQTKYSVSVWTCFEACVASGALKLVEKP